MFYRNHADFICAAIVDGPISQCTDNDWYRMALDNSAVRHCWIGKITIKPKALTVSNYRLFGKPNHVMSGNMATVAGER